MTTAKLIFALSLTLLFTRFCFSQSTFSISGEVSGLDSSELLVMHLIGEGVPDLDTIEVKNNRFEFTGNAEQSYLIQILYMNDTQQFKKLTEFMVENTDISITGEYLHFDSIQVDGSESNRILKMYLEEDKFLRDRWDSMKLLYDFYREEGDSIIARRLGQKMNKILQVDRVELLKSYISGYSDQVVAALLPNSCLIEDQLSAKDYAEMYDALSPPLRQTGYGRQLLEKSQEK